MGIEAVTGYRLFYTKQSQLYNPYIELYWQIAPASVQFSTADSNNIIAKIKTTITITDSTGKTIKKDDYLLQTNAARNINDAYSQKIIEMQRYILPEGKIRITIQLKDMLNEDNSYQYQDSFIVTKINNQAIISQPQLLDTNYKFNGQNIFTKNGNIQIPLCADFVDASRGVMRTYTEIFIPDKQKLSTEKLIVHAYISKKQLGSPIYKLDYHDTLDIANITPVYNNIAIEKLPSGNYYYNITVSQDGNRLSTAHLFFQCINTTLKKDTTTKSKQSDTISTDIQVLDLSTTFVSKYTLPQLKAILKMIKPISTSLENNTIENFITRPDETYIRYFIYNFWKARNAVNPKQEWEKYTQTIKEVNKQFGYARVPGYETERGIIYLKYGKPDEMVTVMNDPGTEPYEIWTYNTLPHQSTGGMLLFYRPGFMLGDFRVLHSNIRGELRNTNWRGALYKDGQRSGGLNARAEQYFPGNK